MGSKVTTPATVDPTATDWQEFIAWVEKAQVGKINISFSNMDTTSEPKIQAGSIAEIAGSLYQFSAEEGATGWSGIANSTQAYMRLVVSGTSVSAEWTTTAPVWRDDLQGWYESGTTKRYVLKCYKDGSGNYTDKGKITNSRNENIDCHVINSDGDGTHSGDNTFSGQNTFTNGVDLGDNGTYLKAKLYTGNLSESEITTISTGIAESKILFISATLFNDFSQAWYCHTSGNNDDAQWWFKVLVDWGSGGDIKIAADHNYYGEPYRIIVWYDDSL